MSTSKGRHEQDDDTIVESPEHTLVTFDVPAGAFALSDTVEALPAVEFECEPGVQFGTSPATPLVWVRGAERDEIEAALSDDASVRRAALVDSCDGEFLYRMEWSSRTRVRVLATLLAGNDAIIREVYGSREGWVVRVLFTAREDVSRARDLCDSHNVDVSIASIREMRGNRGDRFGLTCTQAKSLSLACEMGYFEVPRETDLDEVADALGLTHQSLSERLRRGNQALIRNTIVERDRR